MSEAGIHWHIVNFRFKMLSETHEHKAIHQVDSPVHTLIAYEIFRPVIECFKNDIIVWRFHRSFKPADEVNSFWFLFYGLQSICPKITNHIQSNEVYKKIKHANLLKLKDEENITCEKTHGPDLRDDGETFWPSEIREIWPYYIHGVSMAWLKMIEVFVEKEGKAIRSESLKEKMDLYVKINNMIEEKWCSWGGNAMLHHLNAVFGYKYINIVLPKEFIRNAVEGEVQIGKVKLPGIQAEIRF